jgi:hypothetical protein
MGVQVEPFGASTGSFEVVRCDWDIRVDATDIVESAGTRIETEIYGTGEIRVDATGTVEGTGTYQYNLDITWTPPDTVTCEKLLKSENESTFVIFGTATVDWIRITLKFYPVEVKAAVAKCKDREGKDVNREVMPGDTVDPTPFLSNIGNLNFQTDVPAVMFPFEFGKGKGEVWLYKRKSK